MDCVVLCGGESKRMKPHVPFNKALVELRPGLTLLEHQVEWLRSHGAENILLAIDGSTYDILERERPRLLEGLECSVERERLGTGGAVVRSMELLRSPSFYLMNVDDLILSDTYDPEALVGTLRRYEQAEGAILLGRSHFPFGIVKTSSSRVVGFRQKPLLDYKVCSGHYAFTREGVERYFPDRGNFEESTLQRMAEDRVLYSLELEGEWLTVNSLKELEAVKKRLNQ